MLLLTISLIRAISDPARKYFELKQKGVLKKMARTRGGFNFNAADHLDTPLEAASNKENKEDAWLEFEAHVLCKGHHLVDAFMYSRRDCFKCVKQALVG